MDVWWLFAIEHRRFWRCLKAKQLHVITFRTFFFFFLFMCALWYAGETSEFLLFGPWAMARIFFFCSGRQSIRSCIAHILLANVCAVVRSQLLWP